MRISLYFFVSLHVALEAHFLSYSSVFDKTFSVGVFFNCKINDDGLSLNFYISEAQEGGRNVGFELEVAPPWVQFIRL